MRSLRLAALAVLCSAPCLLAQSTPTTFLTTTGKDTFCFEQYSRKGNVVSGSWVVMHSPGVFVHDYTIELSNDGIPTHYTMKYTTPGDPNPPQLDSLDVVYGRDSATIVFIGRDSSFTRRIAMRDAFPLLGQSFVGVELALKRLRRMHVDSTSVTLHPPTQPSSPITIAPVRFVAADSALVGPMRVHIASDAGILDFRNGALEMRRVAPIDVRALTEAFVREFAPRRAALAAAAAARVEVPLAAAQLGRFVGDYTVGALTATIARDGEHLTLRLTQQQQQQPPIQLLASSPTEFFVRKPDLVITFESDANGNVIALTIGSGDTRQRLTRAKPAPDETFSRRHASAQWLDRQHRATVAKPPPILHQLLSMAIAPLEEEHEPIRGKSAANTVALDLDGDRVLAVRGVKMRRLVIVVEHSDPNLREQGGIPERLEHRPAQGIAEIDRALDAIAEAEPQAMIANVAHVDDARQIEHPLAAEVRVVVQYIRERSRASLRQ